MDAILTLTRYRQGAPEARLSLLAEVPNLHQAHRHLPEAALAFRERVDGDEQSHLVLRVERPANALYPGTRLERAYADGRWGGSHWSTVREAAR